MQHPVTSFYRFDEFESLLTDAPSRSDLFSETAFCDRLSQRLDQYLAGRSILSLDVFDTLILRDNSSEITRFFEIGGKMADIAATKVGRPIAQVDAFVARHLGTKATYRASRRIAGYREGSLTELHSTASTLLTGLPDLASAFIAAEIDYEATRITPNPFLIAYADNHRRKGGKVVLITDMYMQRDQVAQLLEIIGIGADRYDFLISSADTKVSKASGGLFALVERKVGANSDTFFHLGDSFYGDFAQPMRQGWGAMHLPLSRCDILKRREDHVRTATMLLRQHGISLDIAMPS